MLVPIDFKQRIASAAAISAKDDYQISSLVRRAVDELIEREQLDASDTKSGKAA